MAAWKDVTRNALAPFKGGINRIRPSQNQVSSQQAIAILASIIIILMSLGGLGLVFNLYA
jgi:hypothetical protein